MKNNILIVGSGGSNKYDYIKTLIELGANVTILDPEGEDWWRDEYFHDVEITLCSFKNLNEILMKAESLHARKKFNIVDTIFELALEPAAEIRRHLNIVGLTPELTQFGRKKSQMIEFMRKTHIRTPECKVFNDCLSDKEINSILEWALKIGDGIWILRPDSAAAKIGVFKFEGIKKLPDILDKARISMTDHPYCPVIYYNMSDKWILSKYIKGHEVETEVLVDKGEVIYLGMLLKTVNVERLCGIEENRYVMPGEKYLQEELFKDLKEQCNILASKVYENIMSKVGREMFALHPEFRITDDGKAYMLEYAFRNGGGLNPKQILYSHGIDVLQFSAYASLNKRGDFSRKESMTGASGYQMIFSDRCGKYGGIEGIRDVENMTVYPGVPIGAQIKCPHIEVLSYIMVKDVTPYKVDMLLDNALKEARVIIDGERIHVPLSEYRNYRQERKQKN